MWDKEVVAMEASVELFAINFKLSNFDASEVEVQFGCGVRFQSE